MITLIDHVQILERDLQASVGAWTKLGFQVVPGGQHTAFGSENALIPLADGSYIELLTFTDPARAATRRGWSELTAALEQGAGLGSFALLSDGIDEDVRRLRSVGVYLDGPFDGGRSTPAGEQVIWRSAFIGSPSDLLVYPFLIEDKTPRSLRIAPPTSGLGRLLATAGVIVMIREPQMLQQVYRAVTGVMPRHRSDSGLTAHAVRYSAPWGFVDLVGTDSSGSHIGGYLAERGAGIYAVALRAADLSTVAETFVEAGVIPLAGSLAGEECLWLEPRHAAGARLVILEGAPGVT